MVLTARYPARREADPGWFDTQIPIPPSLHRKRLRELLTGSEVHAENLQMNPAEVFRELPIAVIADYDE